MVFDNGDYGKALAQAFVGEARRQKLTVLTQVGYVRERTQDFAPLVARLAGADVFTRAQWEALRANTRTTWLTTLSPGAPSSTKMWMENGSIAVFPRRTGVPTRRRVNVIRTPRGNPIDLCERAFRAQVNNGIR